MDTFQKLTLIVGLLLSQTVSAQDFEKYFKDKTLRIDYLHKGDARNESIEIQEFHSGGAWNGTRSFLTRPFLYGNILLEVYDSVTNTLIFKYSYSTLWNEYKTTQRAEQETGLFEECVNLPFPKQCIRFVFTSFSRSQKPVYQHTAYFNPAITPCQKFEREYAVLDLHGGGTPDECLDILFIPDGYTEDEREKLEKDMRRFAGYVLDCSPYLEHKEKINIRGIMAFSAESGITDPLQGIYKETLLQSSYNVLEVDRYLMCLNIWKMHAVADDAPYDAIVLLCNAPKYGGGGIYNFYASVNNEHRYSAYVIVHELGHSIGGLGDEYYSSEVSVRDYYPEGIEPVEPNLTTLVDFEAKWANLVGRETPIPTPATEENEKRVGAYEGGGYVERGVYRPYIHCSMKETLYNQFCPVCQRTLTEIFRYYANKK